MANPALLISLAFLLSTSLQASQGEETAVRRTPEYVPVRAVVYRSAVAAAPAATTDEADSGGGGYQPFELCMGCRCCSSPAPASDGGGGGGCVDTRCCYAIDCDIPGKPFGVCAFSPHTCGCGQAGNCTARSS